MPYPQELVDHLAYVIGRYPRGGGQNSNGMKILVRGKQRLALDQVDVKKDWYKISTVPTEVAEILLSINWDKNKAVNY